MKKGILLKDVEGRQIHLLDRVRCVEEGHSANGQLFLVDQDEETLEPFVSPLNVIGDPRGTPMYNRPLSSTPQKIGFPPYGEDGICKSLKVVCSYKEVQKYQQQKKKEK